jgi:hypothetical protein
MTSREHQFISPPVPPGPDPRNVARDWNPSGWLRESHPQALPLKDAFARSKHPHIKLHCCIDVLEAYHPDLGTAAKPPALPSSNFPLTPYRCASWMSVCLDISKY